MTKLITIDSLKNLDFEKVGLKCGLEIHQQLNTSKLFCKCPSNLVPNEELNKSIIRNLRFSQGEGGQIDKAALSEFKNKKLQKYLYNDSCACLVELDEEPPHTPNQDAVNVAMRIGLMMDLNFFDKIQFMRKIIIDGSITTGFQRTAMVGVDGHLKTQYGRVEINAINIEEDSCRNIERAEKQNIFSLDRQGIPLIEITTGPQVKHPKQAQELAQEIGNILRSFNETKRGLGTIRQDLNVSVSQGARVEIKGAQNLKLIPEIIEDEVKRQLIHLSILDELKHRGIDSSNFINEEIKDISEIFANTTSKVILSNLKEKNSGVFAFKLKGFKDILGHELQKNFRFATEISKRNQKSFPQVKGLFHSDELPKYGITQEEVDLIKKYLQVEDQDAFILIVQNKNIAYEALTNVQKIILELMTSIPSEVRQVDPKGTLTTYLRPMPGSARMYPETDVEELIISENYLEEMSKLIPERYEKRLERLSKEYKLDEAKVEDLFNKFNENQVKELLQVSEQNANQLYSIIFEIPKDIKKRENIEPQDFKYSLLTDLLKISKKNNLTQKTLRDIFLSLYKDKLKDVSNLEKYIAEKELIGEEISDKELEEKAKEIINKNPEAPFGALMGLMMQAYQGKIDGKRVSQVLRKLI